MAITVAAVVVIMTATVVSIAGLNLALMVTGSVVEGHVSLIKTRKVGIIGADDASG